RTAVSVSASSDWSRNSLGGEVGLDQYEYFSVAGAHYTDWHVGIQGGYTISDEQLTLGYSHQSYHQLGAAIGTVSSATPVSDNTDTAQVQYPLDLGRFGVTPDGSVSFYRYGSATVDGTRLDQEYLNRTVYAGGVTGRYTMTGFGSLLVVARATDARYPHRLAGLPTNNSRNFMLLTGADYHADGPWHYRLLVGGEISTFSAAEYRTRVSPTVEGNVTWTPTALTTVIGTISRSVNDPLAAGVNGDTLNSASLQIDRELLRNIVLEGRGGFQYAQYFSGGGTQSSYTFGGSINYLANRALHVSLDVDYIDQSSASVAIRSGRIIGSQLTGFTQLIAGVTLHIAL
ncbi:MAG: outer membrane beta-barrel protein, partial [Janthinobacterium lividum]